MKRFAIGALAVSLSVVASVATGEPTPTVNWLMNDSVSLFDWGMFKLEQDMKQFMEREREGWLPPMVIIVDYIWELCSGFHNPQDLGNSFVACANRWFTA